MNTASIKIRNVQVEDLEKLQKIKPEINEPNQVWATDITYIRMNRGFMYLVATLDWYSRYVVGQQDS